MTYQDGGWFGLHLAEGEWFRAEDADAVYRWRHHDESVLLFTDPADARAVVWLRPGSSVGVAPGQRRSWSVIW